MVFGVAAGGVHQAVEDLVLVLAEVYRREGVSTGGATEPVVREERDGGGAGGEEENGGDVEGGGGLLGRPGHEEVVEDEVGLEGGEEGEEGGAGLVEGPLEGRHEVGREAVGGVVVGREVRRGGDLEVDELDGDGVLWGEMFANMVEIYL